MKRVIAIIIAIIILAVPMNTVPVVSAATSLATPSIYKVTEGHNANIVMWRSIRGAAKYRVFIKSKGTWKKLGDTTNTTYTHKVDGRNNTTYTYTVRCVSSNGKSYTSGYNKSGYTFTHKGSPKLLPYGVKKSNGTGYIVLNWRQYYKSPTTNNKYAVFIKSKLFNHTTWVKLATVSGKTTSYSIDKRILEFYKYWINPNGSHNNTNAECCVTVRAVDSKGKNLSDYHEFYVYLLTFYYSLRDA